MCDAKSRMDDEPEHQRRPMRRDHRRTHTHGPGGPALHKQSFGRGAVSTLSVSNLLFLASQRPAQPSPVQL